MNSLTDWREWFLALATGLVSAAFYDWLVRARRARLWRTTRAELIKLAWLELAWIWIQIRNSGWNQLPIPGADGDLRLFHAHALQLREFMAREGIGLSALRPELLNGKEQEIAFKVLPVFQRLSVDLLKLLDTLLGVYADAWNDDERLLLLKTRGPLSKVADWLPHPHIPPERLALDLFQGVEICAAALEALDSLTVWVRTNHPGPEKPTVPTARLTEL
jgi:hypothetical protein